MVLCWLPSIELDAIQTSTQTSATNLHPYLEPSLPLLPAVLLSLNSYINHASQTDNEENSKFKRIISLSQFSPMTNPHSSRLLERFNHWCFIPALKEVLRETVNAKSGNSLNQNGREFEGASLYWQGSEKFLEAEGIYKPCQSSNSAYCGDGALLVPLQLLTQADNDYDLSVSCATYWNSHLSRKLLSYAKAASYFHLRSAHEVITQEEEKALLFNYLLINDIKSRNSNKPGMSVGTWLDIYRDNDWEASGILRQSQVPLDSEKAKFIGEYIRQNAVIQMALHMESIMEVLAKFLWRILLLSAPILTLLVPTLRFNVLFWGFTAVLIVQPIIASFLRITIVQDQEWIIADFPPANWQLLENRIVMDDSNAMDYSDFNLFNHLANAHH